LGKLKNILVITYWSYNDALIQTYTLPYVKLIRKQLVENQKIFLVCLEQEKYKLTNTQWKEEVYKLKQENIHLIRFNYSSFGPLMIIKFPFIFTYLFKLTLFNNISHIHTWCTPAGAIGYILSLITGRRLMLDSYEPHAEPMLESGTWEKDSFKFRLLFWLEKKQLLRADKVVTCVDEMKTYVQEKFDITIDSFYSKPACVDFDLFNISKSKNPELIEKYQLENKIIGVYAGKFEGSYLKEEVFELIKSAENYWGKDHFRFIILSSHSLEFIIKMAKEANIESTTIIHLFVPHHEVPKYMGLADFGISPFIPVPSKRYGSPIKNSEYMAMGLPIIITKDISDDSEIIDKNNFGYVLQQLSQHEYSNACKKIDSLLKDEELKNKIVNYALSYRNFGIAENVYARIYNKTAFERVNKKGNVLVLTYWSYKDALIQTYTLPYVRIMQKNLGLQNKIFLLTLEQSFYKMNEEEWKKEKDKLLIENIHLIRFKYSNFGLEMLIRISLLLVYLSSNIWTKNIQTIHSWCTPAGALGYLLSKITGKPLVIDSYEPHAEAMIENGTWTKKSWKFKILFWLEKKQSKRAKTVIALTEGMKHYAEKKYHTTFQHYYVKPALVNLNKFFWDNEQYNQLRKVHHLENKIVCVYTGKMGGIYLNEEFFDFFKVADDYWENKFHLYLLTDKNQEEIRQQINSKKILKSKIEAFFVPHNQINSYLQMADFAVNFVKPVPSKRYCTSIKDGEYWALGLPIVITKNISDDSDIIRNYNIGSVLDELNDNAYLNSIKEIDLLLSQNSRKEIHQKIRPVAEKYRNFEVAEKIYGEIYG
jgi:hypothetical protein